MNTSSQHNQHFAPQPKKTNWGMIILLLILIPLLILGFIYGYKKLMSDPNAQNTVHNNNNSVQQNNISNSNSSSPLTGDWYFEDNGNAPKWFYIKYSFAAPQPSSGGNPKGTVTMAWNDGMYQEKIQNYELINDRTIRITDPNNGTAPPYQIEYTYNAGGQTLEISDQGTRLTYLRNPTAAYNASINKNNNAPTNNNNNATQQNSNNVNTSQLPPVGFDQPKAPANFKVPTSWSNAYDKGNVIISVIPTQNGSKISGEIDCQFFDNNGNFTGDALWYFNGTINGNIAKINVTDLKGNLETKGTLTLSGSKLIFSMNKKAGLLPKYASLSVH